MARTGWSTTLLFEMPTRLGKERMRRLAELFFKYNRAWEEEVWCLTFADWVKALESDMAAIARGLRANPKAGNRDIPEAELRKQIWETHIRPQLPADFVFEFAWLGPPAPEETEELSEPIVSIDPEEYFREVNTMIREAGVPRDIAARWTREVISAQGFDLYPKSVRIWNDLAADEEREAGSTPD
jgi:hypothetical protein